ncbi:MAG: ABC transporter permease [Synergistes sp.]|nr:ABC transporter permease [Synergistes sp.]
MIAMSEVFTASVTALRRNKTRSMLTTLGIIIGVGAVIAAFAIGAGASKSIDDQISSFGSNFISVYPDRSGRSTAGITKYLTYDDARAIENNVSGVAAIAPMISLTATVVCENTNWNSSVIGSTEGYSYVQDIAVDIGRDIEATDVRQGAKVAVVGYTIVDKLFAGENPIGRSIRINKIPFTVVGIFERRGISAMGNDYDDFILVPLTTAQRRLSRWATAGRIGNIYIKGISMESLEYIQHETETLLRERHKIKQGDADDFAVRNVTQMLEARRKTTAVMSMLLGSVALISLVVGGIGIMNIMLVSVTERTREIGIRMAVGATSKDIRMQFLIEAVVLSMIGGAFGILLGVVAGYTISSFTSSLSSFTSSPPIFNISSIMLAFAFSAMVGIGFGYYPAYKASLLNPIDALKYE